MVPVPCSELHEYKNLVCKKDREKTYIASTPNAWPRLCTQQHAFGMYPNFRMLIVSA